jgi:hypothetical protein
MAETGQPGIRGQMMFYKGPEPLSSERHGRLGVNRIDKPFKFLAGSNLVPVTVHEFAVAGLSYPIIFAGADKSPMAVMGARAGENVFVTPEGDVDPEAYLPAYVRRYPFALAAETGGERLVVCIDRAAALFAEGGEIPLFNGDQQSQYTIDAIEFCKQFEGFREATQIFTRRITEFNLWETKAVTVTPPKDDGTPGAPITIAEYFAISEAALATLPLEKVGVLRDEGWLGAIYAHLMSLLLWPKIMNRAFNIAISQAAAARR